MAVAKPKGNAIKIAPKLTQSVPNIKDKTPSCATGCAVGNHSFSDRNCLSVVFSIGKILPLKLESIFLDGKKAIMPGVLSINSLVL